MIPALLAVYLAISSARTAWLRRSATVLLCATIVAKELLFYSPANAAGYAARKRSFQACYAWTLDAERCEALFPVALSPSTRPTMAAKLQYLREGELSFFRRPR